MSTQASAICARVISLGSPSAIWVLRWEMVKFITSLKSLTRPCRLRGRSKTSSGNFRSAPRCLMMALTS